MATKKSPAQEGFKQFGRTLIIGTVSTIIVSLIAIFSLEQVAFIEAVKNPLTWYAFGQAVGLFFLKDILASLGMMTDKWMHIEGKQTNDENLEKGLTRF